MAVKQLAQDLRRNSGSGSAKAKIGLIESFGLDGLGRPGAVFRGRLSTADPNSKSWTTYYFKVWK